MGVDGDGMALANALHRLRHALQLLFAFRYKDNADCRIKQALVVLPHVVHDFLNVLFLHAFRIGDFRGKIIVLIAYPLLLDNVALNAKVFFLQLLCRHVLWHRHHVNAHNGVDR